MSNRTKRILLTGATGIVGAETFRQLRALKNVHVRAVSAHGSNAGIVCWPMGQSPAPAELIGPWDVVVHTAASTRLNMNPEEAVQANVTSTAALREVVGPCTHLVHVSTAFADGKCGSRESRDLGDYRNAYEWSKACAERIVIEQFSPVTIIRPPLIIGRRSDGYIARFTGFYTLLRAVITGLAPLMVGQPDGYLELIPVDDVAAEIVKACLGARPDVSRVVILGRGNLAMSVATTMSVGCEAINNWRTRHDATSLSLPPMITPDRWERFLLPFARSHLSARQLDVIEALSSFVPYLSIAAALRPTIVIEDVAAPLRRSVYFWAERNRVAALRHPAPWVMERSR